MSGAEDCNWQGEGGRQGGFPGGMAGGPETWQEAGRLRQDQEERRAKAYGTLSERDS